MKKFLKKELIYFKWILKYLCLPDKLLKRADLDIKDVMKDFLEIREMIELSSLSTKFLKDYSRLRLTRIIHNLVYIKTDNKSEEIYENIEDLKFYVEQSLGIKIETLENGRYKINRPVSRIWALDCDSDNLRRVELCIIIINNL